MNPPPATLVWLIGLAAAVLAIRIGAEWAARPPAEVDFDKPITRALVTALAGCLLAVVLVLAVSLSGLIRPVAATALIWVGLRLAARRVNFVRARGLAIPLCLVALVTALVLFQFVFGDRDFGLLNVFPDR